jgi:hypothetical protein
MLPDPLHPAVVHFPVVLAFLLPLFAVGALWAIRRGARPRRAWAIPLALAAALAMSAWASVETGEDQEERVERVVGERPLHGHQEAAEVFLGVSVGIAAVAALGLLGGIAGRVARITATIGAAALIILAFRVGHSGGALVYQYGAASAFTTGTPGATGSSTTERRGGDDDHR